MWAKLIWNLLFLGNPQQGQENRNPLPNPWSPNSEASNGSATRTEDAGSQSGGTNANAGLFGSSSLQNLMQSILQNPQTMQSMLSAPYMQSMLQAMAADPDMAANVIGANPLIASNPDLQVCSNFRDVLICRGILKLSQKVEIGYSSWSVE